MAQGTQQNEAMQAVRLLYRYAVKGSDGAEPENIYRARVLLEEFIESAGVLESGDNKSFSNVTLDAIIGDHERIEFVDQLWVLGNTGTRRNSSYWLTDAIVTIEQSNGFKVVIHTRKNDSK